MPFIDSKITLPLSDADKETIKSQLGSTMVLINKPENFLMLGFDDNYDLYMGGTRMEKGAYIAVSLFGNASSEAYEKMTAEICRIYGDTLGIPADAIYITYTGVNNWGWNLKNF